jgi:nucleoid-associated protein YgaU
MTRSTWTARPGNRARIGRGAAAAALAAAVLAGAVAAPAAAQALRGSRTSLDRQNRQARQHDFTYLRAASQLERFVDAGLLVPLDGGAHYRLHDVSFNVARPEVKLFIERLSSQYLAACGERLVVTSLTRPTSHQPSNASLRSVHPTGMAVDLRVPTGACRRWLESTLVALERRGVLDATLERSPLHFHVAVFPREYLAYAARLAERPTSALLASVQGAGRHTVRRSESLWKIADRYGTTTARLKAANGLRSDVIRPGQVLEIPGGR